MGKAQRARLKRTEEEERALREREMKKAERRENIKITAIVVSILLVIAIIVTTICVVVNMVKSTGNYLRNKVGVNSENFEVNNAMMSYFFRDTYATTVQNAISQLGMAATYYGMIPDTSKPLRDQTNSAGKTWYDYFMEAAANNVSNMLVLAEAAKEEGITLTENETNRIDKVLADLKADAEENGEKVEDVIHENYGLGVKESDIKDALEIYYLSQKYYFYKYEGIEISDDEIKDYYDEHKDDYFVVSYKVYTFSEDDDDDDKDDKDDNDKDSVSKKPNVLARELGTAKSPEEFDSKLRELIKDKFDNEEDLDTAIENTLKENETLKEDSEYSEWLFNEKTEVGDTKLITSDDGDVAVYMLTEKSHLNESPTKNVRHILFSLSDYETEDECKAAAEDLLAEYKKDASEDKFAELALKYSSDPGSYSVGGLYRNVAKGQMVEEFEDWLFDDARKAGDCDIVKTSYGYHVMYYVGEGSPAWEADVSETLRSEKYSDIVEDLTEKHEVTVNTKKLKNIPDIY